MSHRSILANGSKVSISNDEYTIERLISRGGTSLIYEAYRPYCHNNQQKYLEESNVKKVIIKELAPFDIPFYRDEKGIHFETNDIEMMETIFMNEICNISAIQRYNTRLNRIPEMDAFGKYLGTMYIAMNHIKGQLLSQYLYEQNPDIQRVVEIFRSMLLIVNELHTLPKAYVHLDLKPSNFMIGGLGSVHLFDFGSSLFTDDGWIKNYTERYSAPEVIYNQLRQVGPASDIYSLGVIFYEMLTHTKSDFEKLLLADGVYYQSSNGEKDYNQFLAKMLAPRPQHRFQSIVDALQEFSL